MAQLQKLYCYVDESGQDVSSPFFVVVAVVSDKDQDRLRSQFVQIETRAKTGHKKWRKIRAAQRIRCLEWVLAEGVGRRDIFFGVYPKPIPYFFPMLDVLEQAIKKQAAGAYTARIYVDGIDRKKAQELTNALRARGISLSQVRSRRDESEPLIRLADMWAGCIRAALLGGVEERILLERATSTRYLERVGQ